ncbi:MAG: hypothetical protein HYU87_10600 [Chloroflexi bacterium]|nr:hypothetical protein [Chloroflexota bacterium]
MTTERSGEVQVAVTSEELEAEVIRSRLAAEGIPARIAAKSQVGMPASWSPRGLGYGIGSFSVRVPSAFERTARELLADVDERRSSAPLSPVTPAPRPRAHMVVRAIATIALIYLLVTMVISLGTWLSQL